jgi:hypothetical protein
MLKLSSLLDKEVPTQMVTGILTGVWRARDYGEQLEQKAGATAFALPNAVKRPNVAHHHSPSPKAGIP